MAVRSFHVALLITFFTPTHLSQVRTNSDRPDTAPEIDTRSWLCLAAAVMSAFTASASASYMKSSQYDRIPILTMSQKVGEVVNSFIDISLRYDQLRNPQIYAVYVSPVVDAIKSDFMSEGIFYCLFANKLHFAKQAKLDVPMAQLWFTRALVCELLANKLITAFAYEDTAQALVYEFYPLADGQIQLVQDVPVSMRSSALELAIVSKSKRFLAHPALVKLINDLWEGRLVYDLFVYRNERLAVHSRDGISDLLGSLRGVICEYDQQSEPSIRLSRLRVPKYRHMMKFVSSIVLLYLYFTLRTQIELDVSTTEVVFSIWALGTCLEEYQSLRQAGRKIYFQTLWSICDFLTMCLLVCYWTTRGYGLIKQSNQANAIASDFFATLGVTLFPRLFCALEASEGFSRTVIGIQQMSIELFYCWISLMFFSFGFWASLSRFAAEFFSSSEVFYNLFQILFGFTPAVWQTWEKYSLLGRIVLFLYLFMAQFVVMTIVIAALSAKYSEIMAMSREEHYFSRALQLLVKTRSERAMLFCYTEPFNVLALALKPLEFVLPTRAYLELHRLALKISHAPILMVIYCFERVTLAINERKEDRKYGRIIEIREQVQRTRRESANLAGISRPREPSAISFINRKRNKSQRLAKTSSLDLIQGVLSFESRNDGFPLPLQSSRLRPSEILQEVNRPDLEPEYHDDAVAGPSIPRLGMPNILEHENSSRETIRPPVQHRWTKPKGAQALRPRMDSMASSIDRQFNTLKLSPTRSYSMFRSEFCNPQNMDSAQSESGGQDAEHLQNQLSMLLENQQRLESKLNAIIECLSPVDESED